MTSPGAMADARSGPAHRRPPILSYLVATLAPLAAAFLRHELIPIWGGKMPFITFYPAVALAAWVGGLGPGLVATALSAVCSLLFLVPLGSLRVDDPYDVVGLAVFVLINVLVTGLNEALHRSRRRVEVRRDVVRQSELRLQAIITSATDAIIAIDAAQKITLFNAGAEAIFGYSGYEMVGQTLDRLVPERFRDVHRRHVDAFGATGVSMRQMGGERVLAGVRRGGEEFPMEARISQVEIDGQKLYTVILRDVTERKRAEGEREELLAVAERARAEAEAALEFLARIQSITETALADLPLDRLLHELIRRVHEALEADTAVIMLEEDGLLHARATVGLEEEVRARVRVPVGSGFAGRIAKERGPVVLNSVRYQDVVSGYIRDKGMRVMAGVPLFSSEGRVLGVLHVGRTQPREFTADDVRLLQLAGDRVSLGVERAARIEAEHRARAEAERAAKMARRVERIADVVLADLSLDDLLREVLVRVQEALETDAAVMLACELAEEELRVRAVAGVADEKDIGLRVPPGRGFCGSVARERRALVWTDVEPGRLVVPSLRRTGVRALAGVPLLSGGRLLGVLQVASVEPRRFGSDEVELLQLAADRIALGMERIARTEAEQRARETLEASNRAKDEFLAMLGHELRNPLSAVRNAVATASLDAARSPRALEIARRQADQLGRLIDDLLDVARITQGRITLRKERVHLAAIIERAVESTRSFIEARGLRLTVALAPEPIRVEADPARLEQVLVNLLSNAAKYTEAGGRIDVVAERHADEVAIHVRDTGIGITPDVLPRIWDLFTQAARTLDRAQGGLGIGLTVARRLVELHGARIEARSEGLGKGAEFVVTMPALPMTAEEARPVAAAEPVARAGVRVLVVEDNPDTAESLTTLLELLGHRVRAVYDGVAAMEAARADVPDVMLVDIGLPGMDGYEVARRVRRDPDLKEVVLVALTGYGREEDKKEAMAAGFDHHLVKPVNPDALNGLVARFGKDLLGKPATIH